MSAVVVSMIGCNGDSDKVPGAMESILKNKEVRVLTEGVNAPFEFGEGTGFQGLGADVGEEVVKGLGQPLKWAKSKGYDHMFDVLKEGGAEMIISSVSSDPQKAANFSFSEPYYETGDVIAYRSTEFSITSLASLSNRKVGVAEGRPADSFMTTQTTAAGVEIARYQTMDDALGALNRGEIDAVVGDEMLINYSSVKSYQNTRVLDTIVNRYSYAVAVRKKETELLKKINEKIGEMKSSGELAELQKKWMGNIKEESALLAAKDRKQDELKRGPKTISVVINKQSGAWSMDRLDGFQFVLNGTNGQFKSTAIMTEGNRGNCHFKTPVPPGDYQLNISILGVTTPVHVPELPKSSLTMTMNIGGSINSTFQ